jgi:hypothetical protein
MEIQQIGNGKVVIYIKGEELKCLPAFSQNITTNEAAEILRLALGSTYDDSWESVYFELFPGRDSLLLFALQHSGSPSFFTFGSIEPLISAARDCPQGLISYLTCINDAYILIVYPWHGDSPPAVLFEYGEELCLPALYALHLSEHSRVLAGPTALDELKAVFG